MSSAHPTPTRDARRQATFQLWLTNVLIGTLVGTLWLVHLPTGLSAWLWLYVPFALISSVATLAVFPGIFFALSHRFMPWRSAAWVQAFVGAVFLGALYTDTIIYRLLRYHFNGAVLNVIATPGSRDAVHLGFRVWGLVAVSMVIFTVAEFAFLQMLLKRAEAREAEGRQAPLALRPRFVCMAFLLPVVFVEKSVYAAADIANDREVKFMSRPLPIYPQARISRFLDPEGRPSVPRLAVLPPDALLAYPIEAPSVDPDGPRPNLFLLVVDSWRKDAFTRHLTPNLVEFAKEARVFADHISGGNGTRYGLFSILYGLHGSYWAMMLNERRPPVLLTTLAEQGYDMRVFSSASMNFPEFRDTAWVDIGEHVIDGEGGEFDSKISSERDEQVAGFVEDWLAEREASGTEKPFFCFVLLDSPHQPYYNPGGPHQPVIEQLDYIELATTTDPELVERVQNSYLNSVMHADRVAGRILSALETSGELDDTVVLVTGDHGEEFQENGYWGHTSNFSPEQLDVPFLLRGPGVEPGREARPTSHTDVSGSLLELLGADPARRGDYTLGESLFDPPNERDRVVAGWSHIGLLTKSGVFQVPLVESGDELEVYGPGWRMLPDVEERCLAEIEALDRLVDECGRFLRQP
jgi:membrane-anchored protein YejM (alkaline phosphatase superfamily)